MYRILGVVCIVLAMAASVSAGPAITTGLMAYYGFDDAAGLAAGVAADTSGHGYNGTLSNTVTVTAATGKLAGAVSIANSPPYALQDWTTDPPTPLGPSAAPDFINLPGASMNPSGLDAFSFAVWVKPSLENVNTNWIFLSGVDALSPGGTPNTQYRIYADASHNCQLRLRNAVGDITFVNKVINPPVTELDGVTPAWVHLAFSYDKAANAVKMYGNGMLMYSGTAEGSAETIGAWTAPDKVWNAANNQYTHSLRLGCAANDQTNGFGGLLDEVYFFNSAITDAQAETLYDVGNYLQGDANKDFTVNVADLTALLNNYNKTSMVWTDGDFNGDATVNVADLTLLLNNYNKTFGAVAASSVVPEPSSLVLLATLSALLGAWVIRRRNG